MSPQYKKEVLGLRIYKEQLSAIPVRLELAAFSEIGVVDVLCNWYLYVHEGRALEMSKIPLDMKKDMIFLQIDGSPYPNLYI